VPLGRISEPDEQAEAALFLVSDRASFISGSSLSWTEGWRTSTELDDRAAAGVVVSDP